MGEKFPWREFLGKTAAIALPVALQNLLMTTGSMIDTMMIAGLGAMSVGAVGLCAQFSSLMFACCYIDEPVRYVLMQRHMFSGKWIRPVTAEGIVALEGWSPGRGKKIIQQKED